MKFNLTSGYVLIIDTDSYAGNFERELCAWTTGKIGECGVGKPDPDFKYDNHFNNVTDVEEDGCSRPVTVCQDNNGRYNSVAIFFSSKPTDDAIRIIKEKGTEFAVDEGINIIGYRLTQLTQTSVTNAI